MKKLRLSVHSPEYVYLREKLINRRISLGLSQRMLAAKLGVIYSFVGKVETGDRRLDVFEFIEYCRCLGWDADCVLKELDERFKD